MQARIISVAALAAATLAAPTSAATVVMVSYINGDQAGVATPATGCARFVIDTDANTVDYRIAFGNLAGVETVAHIHGPAAIGASAGVKHTLPPGNPKVGTWTYPESDEADILDGRMYINIHSSVAGGGEIRGQVVDMVCVMDGAQAGIATTGRGYGLFNIDTCTNTLAYHIRVESILGVETVSHIHGMSPHTVSSGVVHGLALGATKVGAWTYAEGQEKAILDGLTYVNIHSSIAGGGEIRGQVTNIVSPFDATQSGVASNGFGCGYFSIDRAANELGYFTEHDALTTPETVAHIHGYAPPGSGAGVVHNLGPGTPKSGLWNYPAGDEPEILDGLSYVNIHTVMFGGGEIRGQIEFAGPVCETDLDCDGDTDVTDLLDLLAVWGPTPGCPPHLEADFDLDCDVDITNLLTLLAGWGACP